MNYTDIPRRADGTQRTGRTNDKTRRVGARQRQAPPLPTLFGPIEPSLLICYTYTYPFLIPPKIIGRIPEDGIC
jgi:hypothetical protein